LFQTFPKATSASAAKDPRKAALAAAKRRLQSQRTAQILTLIWMVWLWST